MKSLKPYSRSLGQVSLDSYECFKFKTHLRARGFWFPKIDMETSYAFHHIDSGKDQIVIFFRSGVFRRKLRTFCIEREEFRRIIDAT